jgi:hypothetical protein
MFRPCWVIFREKPSFVVILGCTIQLSENVLLTVPCAAFGCVTSLWSWLKPLDCIAQPSVTTTEGFSLKITQQGRNT